MTKTEIVSVLQELKPRYAKEGFVILGLFGSYAKDEATSSSDVDILYDLNIRALKRLVGWRISKMS